MPTQSTKRLKVPASRSNQRIRVCISSPHLHFSRTSSHSSLLRGGQGVSVFRPIVYGNTAHPVNASSRPRGMPADHTHLWTISLCGVDNADITHFIKKVQFKLHADTYANPTRSTHTSPFLPCCLVSPPVRADIGAGAFESPPFEVTESGWGEFEIQIKLFFHPESNEKPLTLFHYLKLHPYQPGGGGDAVVATTDVSSYVYEELVFNEPTEAMFETLTSRGCVVLPRDGRGADFTAETEALELDRLGEGLRIVQEEIAIVKEKLAQQERAVTEMRAALDGKNAIKR